MATEFVELQLPMLEKPYKYTGEYRCPDKGEYYLVGSRVCQKRSKEMLRQRYPIVEREVWVPVVDELYYVINELGIVEGHSAAGPAYVKSCIKSGNYFKTVELAEAARDKMVELLKGCAHE